MTDESVWDLSDDELEAAFKEAKAADASPDMDLEQEDVSASDVEEEQVIDDATDEVVNDEEIEDGPEQSDEDSDHDASEEDDADVESDEDADEAEEDTPDEETEAEETVATEEDKEVKSETQQAQLLKFKADGKEYEFSDKEIVDQFPRIFGQAMNYTKKMQAIKPWRKTIDALEQAEVGHDDLNLMIDALKGNKDAVAQVLKRTGVDALDLDLEKEDYVAKDYGRDETTLNIKDVVDTISQDKEFAITENILSKQWDDASWKEMSSNPETISLLHADVVSGMYDTISPIMTKLKVYDGGKKSDLDYYRLAANQYFSDMDRKQQEQVVIQKQQQEASNAAAEAQAAKQKIEQTKAQAVKRTATKKASAKRKAAAPTKARVTTNDAVNYLDDSDEAFEEWYKNLMD